MSSFEYLDSKKYFDYIREHKNIICYGAGAKLRQALQLLKSVNIEPTIICDSNPALWSTSIYYEEKRYIVTDYNDIKCENHIILLTMSSHNAWEVYQFLRLKGEKGDIVQFCNPFKVDCFLLCSEDIDNHWENYHQIYDRLGDAISREIFLRNLRYKITGNMLDLYELTNGNTFFDKDIIGVHTNDVYVDVGAYTGDTICKFLQYVGRGGTSIFMHLRQMRGITMH